MLGWDLAFILSFLFDIFPGNKGIQTFSQFNLHPLPMFFDFHWFWYSLIYILLFITIKMVYHTLRYLVTEFWCGPIIWCVVTEKQDQKKAKEWSPQELKKLWVADWTIYSEGNQAKTRIWLMPEKLKTVCTVQDDYWRSSWDDWWVADVLVQTRKIRRNVGNGKIKDLNVPDEARKKKI